MRKIEFVSYNGSYPNLCSGTVVFMVDGKRYEFYDCMRSGGYCRWGEEDVIQKGDWDFNPARIYAGYDFYEISSFLNDEKDFKYITEIKELNLTDEEVKYMNELINKNVPKGCCGGCL